MRLTRPFVLLALAALLAPRIEASRTSVWESNPPAAVVLAKADATSALAALAPAAAADAETTEPQIFNLGDVVLNESALEHEDRFNLGPLELLSPAPLRGPPPSYPETRVRGFELLPPFRIGASPTLSLWSRQACGSISCGLASDSPEDPWGLQSAPGRVAPRLPLREPLPETLRRPYGWRDPYGATGWRSADRRPQQRKPLKPGIGKLGPLRGTPLEFTTDSTVITADDIRELRAAGADRGDVLVSGLDEGGAIPGRLVLPTSVQVEQRSGFAAGGAGGGGDDGDGDDPREILQWLVEQAAADLTADPSLALSVLSADDIKAGKNPRLARAVFGKAVEGLVRNRIRDNPEYDALFKPLGGANRPDFIGRQGSRAEGSVYEITTATPRSIRDHNKRPYGPSLEYALYSSPVSMPVFP